MENAPEVSLKLLELTTKAPLQTNDIVALVNEHDPETIMEAIDGARRVVKSFYASDVGPLL